MTNRKQFTKSEVLAAYAASMQNDNYTQEERERYLQNASDDLGFIERMIPELMNTSAHYLDIEIVEEKTNFFDKTRTEKIEHYLPHLETVKAYSGNALLQIAFTFDAIGDDDIDAIEANFNALCARFELDKVALANALYMYFIGRNEHGKASSVMILTEDE